MPKNSHENDYFHSQSDLSKKVKQILREAPDEYFQIKRQTASPEPKSSPVAQYVQKVSKVSVLTTTGTNVMAKNKHTNSLIEIKERIIPLKQYTVVKGVQGRNKESSQFASKVPRGKKSDGSLPGPGEYYSNDATGIIMPQRKSLPFGTGGLRNAESWLTRDSSVPGTGQYNLITDKVNKPLRSKVMAGNAFAASQSEVPLIVMQQQDR